MNTCKSLNDYLFNDLLLLVASFLDLKSKLNLLLSNRKNRRDLSACVVAHLPTTADAGNVCIVCLRRRTRMDYDGQIALPWLLYNRVYCADESLHAATVCNSQCYYKPVLAKALYNVLYVYAKNMFMDPIDLLLLHMLLCRLKIADDELGHYKLLYEQMSWNLEIETVWREQVLPHILAIKDLLYRLWALNLIVETKYPFKITFE